MEILLAFAIGYVAGAKGGEQGFSDVVQAARALHQSDEFQGLMDALRSHAASTLRVLADVIGGETEGPVSGESVLDRVFTLVSGEANRPPT